MPTNPAQPSPRCPRLIFGQGRGVSMSSEVTEAGSIIIAFYDKPPIDHGGKGMVIVAEGDQLKKLLAATPLIEIEFPSGPEGMAVFVMMMEPVIDMYYSKFPAPQPLPVIPGPASDC